MSNNMDSLIVAPRFIGPYTADVTISEDATDEITITQHPVQAGAAITDHAYSNPAEVSIKAMFAAGQTPLNTIYELLLALQKSRETITIVTGKRTYENMLIQSLGQTTDATTENALSLSFKCKEIITVSVQTAKIPPRKVQKKLKKTAQTEKGGQKQPQPEPPKSALRTLWGK